MTARASYYASLLDVVDAVATLAGCANLLDAGDSRNSRSVAASLREVSQQARVYLRSMRAAGELDAGETETRRADERAETKRRDMSDKSDSEGDETRSAEWAKAAAAEISLARRILAVHDAVRAATDARKEAATAEDAAMEPSGSPRRSRRGRAGLRFGGEEASSPRGQKKETGTGHASFVDPESFTCESAYCEAMRDLVFDVSAADHMSAGSGSVSASAAASRKKRTRSPTTRRAICARARTWRAYRARWRAWSRRCRSAEAAARSCAWTSAGSSFGPSP